MWWYIIYLCLVWNSGKNNEKVKSVLFSSFSIGAVTTAVGKKVTMLASRETERTGYVYGGAATKGDPHRLTRTQAWSKLRRSAQQQWTNTVAVDNGTTQPTEATDTVLADDGRATKKEAADRRCWNH